MIVIVAASICEALSPGNALVPEGAAKDDVEIISWRFAERGAVTSAPQYLRALRAIRGIGERLAAFFADFDVLLTPTMAQPPPRLGVVSTQRDDFEGFNRSVQPYVTFTQMFNMSGQPAAALDARRPAGRRADRRAARGRSQALCPGHPVRGGLSLVWQEAAAVGSPAKPDRRRDVQAILGTEYWCFRA